MYIEIKQDNSPQFKKPHFWFSAPDMGTVSDTYTFAQAEKHIKFLNSLGIRVTVCTEEAPYVVSNQINA